MYTPLIASIFIPITIISCVVSANGFKKGFGVEGESAYQIVPISNFTFYLYHFVSERIRNTEPMTTRFQVMVNSVINPTRTDRICVIVKEKDEIIISKFS